MFDSASSILCCSLGVGHVFVNFAADKEKKRKNNIGLYIYIYYTSAPALDSGYRSVSKLMIESFPLSAKSSPSPF